MEYLASVVGLSASGKTTAIRGASAQLRERGLSVASFHDRLADPLSREIDALIQKRRLSAEARFYMFLAARRQNIDAHIIPAMQQNDVVLTDRYYPCTIAYQAYGEGLNRELVTSVSLAAARRAIPNRVFVLDIPAQEALTRMAARGEVPQVFDDERLAFHGRVRRGYLEQADDNERYQVIDGRLPKDGIVAKMTETVLADLGISRISDV